MLIALSSVLAASVVAQTSTTNIDVLRSFQGFAYSPTLKLTLDGTETVNGRGKTVHVDTSFLTATTAGGTVIGLVEVIETQDGRITQRSVGDGATLWIYHARQNEYMAIPYGIQDGATPNDYYAKLADGLSSQVEGFGVYPVRFLRDILYRRDSMGAAGSTFRSWTPGFAPVVWNDGSGAHTDPINPNRTYRPDPTKFFVHYANGSNPSKALTFEFEVGATQPDITFAYCSELAPIGRLNRLIDWQLSFEKTGLTFTPDTFKFIPPKTARAIPAPRIGN